MHLINPSPPPLFMTVPKKKKGVGKNPDVDTSFLPDRDREVTAYLIISFSLLLVLFCKWFQNGIKAWKNCGCFGVQCMKQLWMFRGKCRSVFKHTCGRSLEFIRSIHLCECRVVLAYCIMDLLGQYVCLCWLKLYHEWCLKQFAGVCDEN